MKKLLVTLLLNFWLLAPILVSAQDRQTDKCFSDVDKYFSKSSPKVLPTEVQNAYDVKWYFLNLNATNTSVELSGDVTIQAEAVWAVMDTFSFHLHQNYTIDSIKVNGVLKSWEDHGNEHWVTPLAIQGGDIFEVQIFYNGSVNSGGNFFAGISNDTDNRWGGNFNVTWTLSEPNNAYQWFPVKQNLTDKADSCWVFVTTTKPNLVASNGLLTNTVDLPDNKVRYEWKSSYPIDYYLISIAVAEYQDYSIYATIPQTGEQLLIQNYIYNNEQCLNQNKVVMDKTAEMITTFSEMFGEYPFSREKYGHALAWMGGAMEHQTMTTTGFFDENLIAHELAHQWFGDNVTCASWQHIWLNEGFATYCANLLWEEHKNGRIAAFNNYKTGVINPVLTSGATGSVFVPIEEIDNDWRIFNNILSYAKGSTLLHMIRYEIGDDDELFFNILQTYQNRYKDNVATSEDFQSVLEELSEKDFTAFFNQWLYGEGYPRFTIKWHQTDNQLKFSSTQTATVPNVTPLFKVTYEIKITYTDNSSEIVAFYHDEKEKQFIYDIPDNKTVKSLTFNPNGWLLANATIQLVTSIDDFSNENNITVYPNPTTGELSIEMCDMRYHEICDVEVFDVYGRNVLPRTTYRTPHTVLDISDLQVGVYFLQITTKSGIVMKKIIKH
jgi:aminopeptidase N